MENMETKKHIFVATGCCRTCSGPVIARNRRKVQEEQHRNLRGSNAECGYVADVGN